MKNETAKREIESLDYYLQNHTDDYSEESHTAMMMAIKALEQEPCDVFDEYGNYKYPSDVELIEPNTATSMPCEDAISRQAVIDAIDKWVKAEHILEPLPTDKVSVQEPKTGHWMDKGSLSCRCSECGCKNNKETKFCPNCGARMKEVEE